MTLDEAIGYIQELCYAVSDTPCGCDACPYGDTVDDDEICEVMKAINKHGGATMQNESWFTDDFNRCDNCPDWNDEKGCKSHGKGCDFEEVPDNEG